jgi:peptidoglycan/LPS O-acetylase OafA/YrhL
MGTVRTVLALLVALSHMAWADTATQHPLTGGAMMAVNLFFIISGFYMALILRTKYVGDVRAFYVARALRLYPLYWVVVVVSLILIHSVPRASFVASVHSPIAFMPESQLGFPIWGAGGYC